MKEDGSKNVREGTDDGILGVWKWQSISGEREKQEEQNS